MKIKTRKEASSAKPADSDAIVTDSTMIQRMLAHIPFQKIPQNHVELS